VDVMREVSIATTKVKTSELVGAALDWAVGVAVGEKMFASAHLAGPCARRLCADGYTRDYYSPSTDWAQGGPLLDAHCKSFGCVQDRSGAWRAFGYGVGDDFDPSRQMRLASGHTILVAACRAIVAAKLGDTVEIPNELLEVVQ
jgi:hypothetical protein